MSDELLLVAAPAQSLPMSVLAYVGLASWTFPLGNLGLFVPLI